MLLGRPGDPQAEVAAALAEDPRFLMGHCLRAAVLILSADEAMERRCASASLRPRDSRLAPTIASAVTSPPRARGWSATLRVRPGCTARC